MQYLKLNEGIKQRSYIQSDLEYAASKKAQSALDPPIVAKEQVISDDESEIPKRKKQSIHTPDKKMNIVDESLVVKSRNLDTSHKSPFATVVT